MEGGDCLKFVMFESHKKHVQGSFHPKIWRKTNKKRNDILQKENEPYFRTIKIFAFTLFSDN